MNLQVCDASALVEYLLLTETGLAVRNIIEVPGADVHVPALCDVEVASALRRILREPGSVLTEIRAKQAIADLLDLPLARHTHEGLLEIAFAMRNNLSIYDAVYVALAVVLDAQLVTADRALAFAPLPVDLRVLSL